MIRYLRGVFTTVVLSLLGGLFIMWAAPYTETGWEPGYTASVFVMLALGVVYSLLRLDAQLGDRR